MAVLLASFPSIVRGVHFYDIREVNKGWFKSCAQARGHQLS